MLKTFKFSLILLIFAFFSIETKAEDAKYDIKNLKHQARAIVTEQLKNGNQYQKVKAIEVISNTKQQDLMPIVEKMMANDYIPVRFAAAVAVGDMKYSQSLAPLNKLVDVGDPISQVAAAYALARLGDTSRVPLIQRALFSDDQILKANAAMLIGKLGNKADLPALYKVLRDEKASDAAMFQAAEAIASIGDTDIYQRLWTMLISKHPDDRIIGIRAMAALKTADAKNAILTMLYDEVLEVRLVAAAELGKLGENSGMTDVIDALTKPLTQIDKEAMERAYSYRKKGDSSEANSQNEPLRPVTQQAYRTQDEYQEAVKRSKELACLAIGYIKSIGLYSFLPQLMNDPDADIRLAAAQSVLLAAK